jgi:hypothetical protein
MRRGGTKKTLNLLTEVDAKKMGKVKRRKVTLTGTNFANIAKRNKKEPE